MRLQLTVIDQTPIHGDRPYAKAAQSSVDLALACEGYGYHRYWLAEHHNSIQFAGPAPEILLTRIASATQRMRVGSGGVMLTHYSPYKVAESFALLGSLFPGRIDLGIGRAPGGSQLTSMALAEPAEMSHTDHFPRQAAELCAFLRGNLPNAHPYAALQQPVPAEALPSLWMLGSGGGSSALAGRLGMGLALARFIAPRSCSPAIFGHHTRALEESGHRTKAQRLLALAVVCAQTDDQARLIASTAAYRKMMSGCGPREPLLSPEQVRERYVQMNPSDRTKYDMTLDDMVVGSPETCRNVIHALAKEFGCEEVGIVTVTYRFSDRLESYRLLANAITQY
ncbi:MsnO8 family LLM class oxidoreductase [Pseudomonas helleri]|uniref:MsnO8 family LLM class oxidoreductase n=1 Tax=Pseudomonas helleri TaxID=1608996 RepID=UPI000F01B89B